MAPASSASWVLRPRGGPADPRVRLICLPHAGGGASVFRDWTAAMPPGIEVAAVKLPGRESRLLEPPATSLPVLLEAMTPALLPVLDRPFALFGHSMGSVIALELARWLRRELGRLPLRLFVSGHRPPHLPDREPPMHLLPDAEFVAEIRRRYGGKGGALDEPELLDILLPTLRADVTLNETHVVATDAPLECPLTALGGREDFTVSRREIESWREYTSAEFRVHDVAGDHFFVQGSAADVARIVGAEIEEALAGAS